MSNELIENIVDAENLIVQRQNELEKYPEALKLINDIENAKASLDEMWGKLKKRLAEEGDYEPHEIEQGDYSIKYSISKVSKVVAEDFDLVPSEFISKEPKLDEAKANNYMKLYGVPPAGCVDSSYIRFNKKITRKD